MSIINRLQRLEQILRPSPSATRLSDEERASRIEALFDRVRRGLASPTEIAAATRVSQLLDLARERRDHAQHP